MQLIEPLFLLVLDLDHFVEFCLGEGGFHARQAAQGDLSSLEVESDSSVDAPQEQLQRLQLDVKEVQAEHRDQVVCKSVEIYIFALVDLLTRNVVV